MSTTTPIRSLAVAGVHKRFGSNPVLIDISLEVADGEIVALLGPSGCGKTTLLRTMAGLERPDSGSIHIGEVEVAGPNAWVNPERRNVGLVFQDWALFPHLSVAKNVSYGLHRNDRNSERVAEVLELVGLGGFGDRSPSTLSGGQQQRVALARALAPQPSVLLLDEPFSNLDTALRVDVRTEVHHLLIDLGITAVFVTHDQEEAFVLGDRVAVMNDGQIEQVASPNELYTRPATRWVASFVGDRNLLSFCASGSTVDTPFGAVPLHTPTNGMVDLLLRPEDLRLSQGDAATVKMVEYYGHDTMVVVDCDDGITLAVRTSSDVSWRRGDRVSVAYQGAAASCFAASTTTTPEDLPIE